MVNGEMQANVGQRKIPRNSILETESQVVEIPNVVLAVTE